MAEQLHDDELIVFICYAHKDGEWLSRLLLHLKPLRRNYRVTFWSSPDIQPGARWNEDIQETLRRARVAVLLVSPNFISSDYICNRELPLLLTREHEDRDKIKIIPVHVATAGVNEPFKYPHPETGPEQKCITHFQSPNDPNSPLYTMDQHGQDKVFLKVVEEIRKVAPPKGQRPEQDKRKDDWASIRKELLSAVSIPELERVLYRVDQFLTKYPNDPEGRLLRDQTLNAIKVEARSVEEKEQRFKRREWKYRFKRIMTSPSYLGIIVISAAMALTLVAYPSLPKRIAALLYPTPTPTPPGGVAAGRQAGERRGRRLELQGVGRDTLPRVETLHPGEAAELQLRGESVRSDEG